MRRRDLILCCALVGSAGPVLAIQVQLGGVMGGKAMLVIDGQTQMLAVGQSARGVRLVSLNEDSAQVEVEGRMQGLRVGGSPVAVDGGGRREASPREIVLTAGPGGHFTSVGSINGRAVNFLVDTGATAVSISQADAARIGLDLKKGQPGLSNTANGSVPVVLITLDRVRVGSVEVANVQGVVMPTGMPYVLLGNSFLTRFQMQRENDVMRLQLR